MIKLFLAPFLVLCILLPVLAQTTPGAPPPPQKPGDDIDDVVRITTNLVQIDAVVTKNGKPVTDLTANDFEIYEDGRKQTITSFAYISNVPATTSQPATAVKGKGRDAVPFTPVNPNDPRRTIAFVVDDLGLSAESLGHLRNQLRKFIAEQLQPNDLVAILRTGGELGTLQQFTNDRRLLTRAVDQLRWNPCSRVGIHLFPAAGALSYDPEGTVCSYSSLTNTLTALRFIVDAMGELPGRKSMVVLSDSMPLETQEPLINQDSRLTRSRIDGAPAEDRAALDSAFGISLLSYAGALQRIAEKAIRSSVVIYSVDTQGLPVTGITAADWLAGGGRDLTNRINSLLSSRSRLAYDRRQGGDLIARQTGGFQIRNSNSFQFNRILEDQSGYYLIGYRPTEETFNRRFHRIKAKVKRSGMTVRTRFGFFGVSEEEANKGRRSVTDLTNLALASPFRAQDINVDMTSFFVNDKTAGSVVRSFVYLHAKDMTFTPVEGRQQASFELHGVIFGDNGTVVEQTKRGATLTLSQSDYEHAMAYGMGLTFDMPVKRPGEYQVRIAARDRVSSRIGSAGQFVAVPNLNNKRLAVSGVVLGTGSNTGKDLANPGARTFTPNSELHFVYMIYNAVNQSGALRNLVMQAKLFRDGKSVYSGAEVPINAVADQSDSTRVLANGSLRLTPELEPGRYYLQVTVTETGGKKKVAPVVQWVDFEIEQTK